MSSDILLQPRRSEFWNLDNQDYYFNNLHRFVEENYVPNEEDIVMARVKTVGLSMTEFDQDSVHFSVVDVGGQRSERKKWMHHFDGVKVINVQKRFLAFIDGICIRRFAS